MPYNELVTHNIARAVERMADSRLLASILICVGYGSGLTGASVVITNTFQGAQTEGAEVDVSAFKLVNNQFATVDDAVEFPDFITLYDVDVSADMIRFASGTIATLPNN